MCKWEPRLHECTAKAKNKKTLQLKEKQGATAPHAPICRSDLNLALTLLRPCTIQEQSPKTGAYQLNWQSSPRHGRPKDLYRVRYASTQQAVLPPHK
mmetsp:Transcript_34478/g.64278  ORF Transcript_34478/g.64278 Transcript_34478/m.64278 type:complete len:97 (-) Transcript_34478:2299-2589(-)